MIINLLSHSPAASHDTSPDSGSSIFKLFIAAVILLMSFSKPIISSLMLDRIGGARKPKLMESIDTHSFGNGWGKYGLDAKYEAAA